ncbi:MAG TPA: M1 family metallopeptidase [Rhizomicrobium sp.]|nr:M1 family metallopeptidase [Rhizomicrobium sp.]
MKPVIVAASVLIVSTGLANAANRVVLPANVTPSHYDISVATDATHLAFTGSVKIDVDVRQPAKTIELNAADMTFGRVSLSGVTGAPKVAFDAKEQTATLTFPSQIAAGHHVLAIDYKGKIYQQAAGLFALDYDTAKGKRRALFTQFENSDARRFVPSWDEPNKKATFTLTATVPADQMAIANTPIVATDSLPGSLKRVHFAASPKMSSYLLFFGAGDFERVSRKVNGVDIGIIVKRGDTDKAGYALDAASAILPFYEDYFGVKYPLPKLDLIAGPGSSQFFGAMENWGAIFYFERDLEIDAKTSTESDKRGVYITIAHEMAHQWFGDLVTMDWWEDLWLNEGFASWMELKATDHFHPEWKVWMDSIDAKEGAMRVDARAGTHPIVTPILDVLQANEAFDTITYSKGQAVIRMLENYVGADVFRAGVRNYIKAHAYGNTVTDDLWRELDKTSPRPVTQIAHDFTLQAGVPLVRVAPTAGGVRLTQERFAMDATAKAPLTWHVPVLAQSPGDKAPWRGTVAKGAPVQIAAKPGVVVNEGQAGYFRTAYDPALLKAVAARFADLSAEDQFGLLNDTRALGYSGYAPLTDFLSLAQQTKSTMDPQVQAAVAARLQGIDSLYDGLPGQPAFRSFGRTLLDPLFAKVGWDAVAGESQNTALLRETLLDALSQFDDPGVIAEARKRFAAYLRDPSHITPDTRRSMLEIVALHADATTWEQLHTLAKNGSSALIKDELYRILGTVRDRALAAKALALTLGNEVAITTRPSIVRSVGIAHPDMAFDFVTGHQQLVMSWLEGDSQNQFAPRIATSSNDPKMIAKLNAYAKAHIPATARGDTVKATSAIGFNSEVRAKRLPEVDRWIAAKRGE